MYRKRFSPTGSHGQMRLWLPLLFLFLLPTITQGQTTVAEWDFESQLATTTTSIPANVGKTIGKGGSVGTIQYTSVGGPNGSYAYATGWANGANSKYWVVNIVTTGYQTLTLSSEQWSEYSFFQYQGPRDFKIQYSLNSSTWTDVAGGGISCTVNNQGMKKGTLTNLALPAACENQASVYLRWIMSSNTGGNGSDPVSGGQNWIDNISIKGQSMGGGGNTPPTITAISNQSTNEDATFGPLGFTVGDAETAAGSLIVTATSSNTALVSNGNISLGGSGANRTITLTPTSNASGSTTITVDVNDGTVSTTETFVLTVVAVNDAPVLAGLEAGTLGFTEDGTPINVTSTITVSDVDDVNMESATVSISSGFVAGEDVLSFTNTVNITGSFAGGVLTLTGSDSKANYQAALRSVKYQNSNTGAPNTGTRTLSFAVNDGSAPSNTLTRSLTITAVNDAPVLSAVEMTILNFIEDGAPINVTSTIVVTDVDDTNIESAEVSIMGFVPSEDVLTFTNTANISGNFAGGVLTLTGSDTKANYQAALRSVKYQNTNTILPNTGPRTLSFSVNDGDDQSMIESRKLSVTEVNDPPKAVAGLDHTESCILPTGTIVNVDGSSSFDIESDKLSYVWSVNGTLFASTAIASTNLIPGVYTLTLTVNDGRGGIDSDDIIVNLIPDVTAPTLTVPANMTFNTDPGVCTFTDPGNAIGSATATDDCPYPIIINSTAPGVYPKGSTVVTWTATDASGNTVSGNQTITVLDNQPPMITKCPASVTVEGSLLNTAQVPNLIGQLIASDNCTIPANLQITQNPVGGTTVGAGIHTVTFTVVDESNNQSVCTTDFTVVRRVEIDPVTAMTVVSSSCKRPVNVTRSIQINNSGDNFGGGLLQWTASTSASELSLLSSSGYEGDDLVFTVSISSAQTTTINRTITINGWNSVSNALASNSPYTMTVVLEISPIGTVSVTQSVGSGWTAFLNSSGQKVAEVKSNAGTISSFTVNAFPCMLPPGLSRIRYVQRYFTMSSSASNPNVDVRLYYSNTEALGLITQPAALTIWQKPLYMWTDLGGTSNTFENYVQLDGLTSLTGPFALAHNWFPKEDVPAEAAIPVTMTLEQNYPNPFNPTTTINFALPAAGSVQLTVHDMLGREVARLADGGYDAGSYQLQFDASALAGGVYTYTLRNGDTVLSRQMQLVK